MVILLLVVIRWLGMFYAATLTNFVENQSAPFAVAGQNVLTVWEDSQEIYYLMFR